MDRNDALATLKGLGGEFPGLQLLVLHGSRARGDINPGSDWDFAYLANTDLDLELRSRLVGALKTGDIDLADLSNAGGLLRYLVARDGVVVFERTAGSFEMFCYEAATFWLEIEPVVRREHREILAGLG